MCRLINTLKNAPQHCKSPPDDHCIPDEVQSDIQWWMYFLQHFNGFSVIAADIVVSNPHLFATDACLSGRGAVCFGEFFHCKFPEQISQQRLCITRTQLELLELLELFTVLVAVKIWHRKLQGLNEATVLRTLGDLSRRSPLFLRRSSVRFSPRGAVLSVTRTFEIPLPLIPGSPLCPFSALHCV